MRQGFVRHTSAAVAFGVATIMPMLILGTANAAPAAPAPAAAPATPATSGDGVERARVHYERGIQLYNEENYDAALFEFERAYELSPSYKILYNVARIQRQQNNYAAAMRNFRRYVNDGGTNVPEDRRREVEREIDLLKSRVATIDIKVNVDGADVYLDDSPVCSGTETGCIGKSPLPQPVTVNPGRRKITVLKQGYQPGTAIMNVVGADSVSTKIDLVSASGKTVVVKTDLKPIISWTAAGVLAVGTGIAGYLAIKASNDLSDQLNTRDTTSSALSKDRTNVKTFALVTDVLGAATLLGVGVALYFTFAPASKETTTPDKDGKADAGLRLGVVPGPGSLSLTGRF